MKMIMSTRVRSPMSVQGQNTGQISILKILKFDIGLIKILFCSVAKVEPLVLKRKIWLCCIDCFIKTLSTNLDSTFRKSYAVMIRTPVTASMTYTWSFWTYCYLDNRCFGEDYDVLNSSMSIYWRPPIGWNP